jgi:MSHA biogenesis protein MshI
VLPPYSAGGKPRVVKNGALPGAQLDAEALAKLSGKIAAPGCAWTLPLSRKEYSIMVIPEPPVLPAEMEQSIRWTLATMIDYPVDEASVAWMKIPTAELLPNRLPHLYVMVARNELIGQRAALFQQAKTPLRAVDVRETAQRNIAALAEQPGEGLGLLLAGRQGIQFTITFNGELYLDRFVEESLFDSSAQDEDARNRAFERIALQVQRSLDFVSRTMPFMTVGRILVAPTPTEIGLREYLAQSLGEPVEALKLGSIFDFSRTSELAKEENQALYFTALGAALRYMGKTA